MIRPTWQQALKKAAVELVREAERLVGANDDTPCANCPGHAHKRSQHCGCGTVCLGDTDGGTARCECQGFVAKPEPEKAG